VARGAIAKSSDGRRWQHRAPDVITHLKEISMKTIKQLAVCASLATMALGLAGCSGMSTQDRNTALGAGAGAVVGGVLTGGSAVGTVGGAAVGGVIGNQVKSTH
jgi:osmotically inducible lipoprotein OsmB